ncbi:MAG: hypothetical protein WD431_04095 [Cyclobacteriaceae bacterium]
MNSISIICQGGNFRNNIKAISLAWGFYSLVAQIRSGDDSKKDHWK